MFKKRSITIILVVVIFVSVFNIENNSKTSKIVSYNGNNLKISVDGIETTTLPTSGTYYLANYSCKSADTVVTWDKENYKLNVSNGTKKGGVACYLDFQSQPKLADMKPGSYVAYTGNNGCSGESCNGRNANYVSEDKMGYCYSSNYQFTVNGWRIAYIKDGSAYLISAGSTDCMCTGADGTSSDSSCSDYLSIDNLYMHFDNMNEIALKYCNSTYAKGGVCDGNTSWSMNANDFQNIMVKFLLSSCYNKVTDKTCGYTNGLIDNGGYYWFATRYSSSSVGSFFWKPDGRYVTSRNSSNLYGVRPILKLASSVSVVGGSGTYEDPYQIANNTFSVNGGTDTVNASNASSVQLSLIGTENVATMCISVDTSGCSNYVDFASTYTLDWSSEEDGEKVIYVYYKDAYGNVVASLNKTVLLDTVAPTNTIKIVDGETLRRSIVISGTGADTMCFVNLSSIDDTDEEEATDAASESSTVDIDECVRWVDYQSSKKWKLSDGIGEKIVQAFFKDKAGNISTANTSVTVGSYKYSIDEDFFDTTTDSNINIVDGTTYPWEFLNGRFQSVNQGINSSTSFSNIQFTPTDDTVLSFDYGVSSESGFDKLTITLTGSDSSSVTLVSAVSGKTTGSKKDVNLTSGVTYTLRVSYVKDSANSFYDDFAYIDNLVVDVK